MAAANFTPMCPSPPRPMTPTLCAGLHVPVAQRRIGRDAGTEERRHGLGVEAFGHAQDEVFIHDDGGRVPAMRGAAQMGIGRPVGLRRAVLTVLLVALRAGGARTAAVHQAPHANEVADLVRGDLGPDRGDAAHDFMARHQRIRGHAPVVVSEVDVGVTDPAIGDVDRDVPGTDMTARDRERFEILVRALGSKSRGVVTRCVESHAISLYFLRCGTLPSSRRTYEARPRFQAGDAKTQAICATVRS